MPILTVQLIGDPAPEVREGLAARIADAAAPVLGSHPRGTWVRLSVLPRGDYAESGGGPGVEVQPVFVTVLRRDVPVGDALRTEVAALTAAVARSCGRPQANVHVLYDAPALGRLAFGGKIVE